MVGNHRNFKRRIIWLAALFAVTLAIQADSQAPSKSVVRPPVRKEFLPPAPPEHKLGDALSEREREVFKVPGDL